MTLTLEDLYTSTTAGFGVAATPTQRAVLRVIEGRALQLTSLATPTSSTPSEARRRS